MNPKDLGYLRRVVESQRAIMEEKARERTIRFVPLWQWLVEGQP